MAYVGHFLLTESHIRAKMADNPEQSDHTSIQLRIRAALKGEQPQKQLPTVFKELVMSVSFPRQPLNPKALRFRYKIILGWLMIRVELFATISGVISTLPMLAALSYSQE
jgi:hypothetical protein